jgi:hypothetical protein
MRRARVAWLGMLALTLTGCMHDRPGYSTSLIRRITGPSGPDAVYLEYAVIERPAGNAAVNRQVWTNIDEMIIDTETRAILAENGLRAGVVGGLLPPELDAMIANPKSETGLRRWNLYVNNPAAIPLNGPVPSAEYRFRPTMRVEPTLVKFEQARFSMTFTPSFAADGRLELHCVPEVEYQDKKRWLPVGAVGVGWLGNKPIERHNALAFDVKLSPREYLVIGSYFERGDWIGNQEFTGVVRNEKVQRLLVIRASRLVPTDSAPESASGSSQDKSMPLATQAFISAARSNGP